MLDIGSDAKAGYHYDCQAEVLGFVFPEQESESEGKQSKCDSEDQNRLHVEECVFGVPYRIKEAFERTDGDIHGGDLTGL